MAASAAKELWQVTSWLMECAIATVAGFVRHQSLNQMRMWEIANPAPGDERGMALAS